MRKIPMRSCDPTVVLWRPIAAVARVIAVENPMQYSVCWTSLSMVLNADHLDSQLIEPRGVAERVVAADGDQVIEPQPLQISQDLRAEIPGVAALREGAVGEKIGKFFHLRRIGARRMQNGSAEAVDGAGVFAVQGPDVMFDACRIVEVEMGQAFP